VPSGSADLSTKQAAKRLNIPERTLRSYIAMPPLAAYVNVIERGPSGRYRIPEKNLPRIADILSTITGRNIEVLPPLAAEPPTPRDLASLSAALETVQALRDAIRVIDAQRQEIERLREALAEKSGPTG